MTSIYRQGDVLLIKVADMPADVDPAPADPRGVVLAEGESSGHHHQVFGRGMKLFRFRDASAQQLLVTGKKAVELRVVGGGSGGVPRHEPITVPPGLYLVRTQRSWTSEHASRQVQD